MAHLFIPQVAKNYELIEHTADIGIRVKGRELADVFKNAALALFDIVAEKKAAAKPRWKSIRIEQTADSLEELLINWLNELLSLSQTREVIFTDFKIEKLTPSLISAQATACPITDYRVNVEIKAATYHQLKIEKAGALWQAEVIVDV